MSVNYKRLADEDVGGELESAFGTMSVMTVETTPEVMVTYRKVGAEVGLTASAELETAMKTAEGIPDWVNIALSTDGINVNDPQVSGLLGALVPDYSDAIIALGSTTKAKYQSLQVEQLEKARKLRAEGIV